MERAKLRIAIVGPVTPFRSGIAKHTTALAKAFAQRDDIVCRVVSFKRQYPAFLYPGVHEKDPHGAALIDPPTEYRIDGWAPWSWLGAAGAIARFEPDLVVAPAWTFALAPCLGWLARQSRKRGKPVVMVVHNAADHDSGALKAWIMGGQLKQASAFVTHNRGLADALFAGGHTQSALVHPHPIMDGYPVALGARKQHVELLFFGLVRPYKGLETALRALALTKRKSKLRIVGEFWGGAEETVALIRHLGLEDRVDLIPRYVSDAEAANYFASCDAVVLPYKSVTGSGVVPLAYHYGKPVIVSDLPGLTEVVENGQTGWVVPSEDPQTWAEAFDKTTAKAANAISPAIEEVCRDMTWERFAATVLEVAQVRPESR